MTTETQTAKPAKPAPKTKEIVTVSGVVEYVSPKYIGLRGKFFKRTSIRHRSMLSKLVVGAQASLQVTRAYAERKQAL